MSVLEARLNAIEAKYQQALANPRPGYIPVIRAIHPYAKRPPFNKTHAIKGRRHRPRSDNPDHYCVPVSSYYAIRWVKSKSDNKDVFNSLPEFLAYKRERLLHEAQGPHPPPSKDNSDRPPSDLIEKTIDSLAVYPPVPDISDIANIPIPQDPFPDNPSPQPIVVPSDPPSPIQQPDEPSVLYEQETNSTTDEVTPDPLSIIAQENFDKITQAMTALIQNTDYQEAALDKPLFVGPDHPEPSDQPTTEQIVISKKLKDKHKKKHKKKKRLGEPETVIPGPKNEDKKHTDAKPIRVRDSLNIPKKPLKERVKQTDPSSIVVDMNRVRPKPGDMPADDNYAPPIKKFKKTIKGRKYF